MAASTSKTEIQTCSDKNLTNFDEKMCRDMNKFPVNFSGVPHIGLKIFGYLDFEDLNNCRTVCKGWHNFLGEKRSLWIELLEKEKIKLEMSENYDSYDLSDCSDDSLDPDEKWQIHIDEHDSENVGWEKDKDPMDMDYEESEFNVGTKQEILECCHKCCHEEDERLEEKREHKKLIHLQNFPDDKTPYETWVWLIEKVKSGPVSDMICLLPKICHVDLFGDMFEAFYWKFFHQEYVSIFKLMVKHEAPLDEPDFLREAIQAKNVEMVKFIAPKIKASHFLPETYVKVVKDLREMAEQSENEEILEFLNSWIDSEEWQGSSENSEEEN